MVPTTLKEHSQNTSESMLLFCLVSLSNYKIIKKKFEIFQD